MPAGRIRSGSVRRRRAAVLLRAPRPCALDSNGSAFVSKQGDAARHDLPSGARCGVTLPELANSARLHVDGLTLFQSLPAGPTTRYEAIDRTHFRPPH